LAFGFIAPDDPAKARSVLHNKELTDMASSGKKKTTMAKLTRESRLRERRLDKQAKRDARKRAPAGHSEQPGETIDTMTSESSRTGAREHAPEAAVEALADA
jgi:hypothetical protein